MAQENLDADNDIQIEDWTTDSGGTTFLWAHIGKASGDTDFIKCATGATADPDETYIADLEDSVIIDSDVVGIVNAHVRARTLATSSGRIGILPFFAGSKQEKNTGALTNSFADYGPFNHASWNGDWTAAQVDAGTVDIRAFKSGKQVDIDFELSEAWIEMNYTLAGAGQNASLISAGLVSRGLISPSGLVGCLPFILARSWSPPIIVGLDGDRIKCVTIANCLPMAKSTRWIMSRIAPCGMRTAGGILIAA